MVINKGVNGNQLEILGTYRNKWKSELDKEIKRSQWESIGVNWNQQESLGINRIQWESVRDKQETQEISRREWEHIRDKRNQQETMIINRELMGISRRYWEFRGIKGIQN